MANYDSPRKQKAREIYEEEMRKKEEQDKNSGNSDFIRVDMLPKFGDKEKRTLRIVPALEALKFYLENSEDEEAVFEDEAYPVQEICNHFRVGAQNQVVACLNFFNKEECPVCEEIEELKKTEDEDDIKYAKELRASYQHVWFVIWREHTEDPQKVWAWHVSNTVNTQLMGLYGNKKIPELDRIFDGTDIEVTRFGMSMKATTYQIDDAREESFLFTTEDGEFDFEAADKLVENMTDIFEYGKPFMNYEETQRVLMGESIKEVMADKYGKSEGDEEPSDEKPPYDADDDKPKRSRPTRGSVKRGSK
jgi:hypothetical protein